MGVFVSHITEEKAVANKLKSLLRQALGKDFSVFVSSDYVSIPGGEPWFSRIIDSLKSVQIVLAVLSNQSVDRRWLNFEAGVGMGATAKVIPVVLRGLAKTDVGPPLSQLQVRDLHDPKDVSALIHDIEVQCGVKARRIDLELFVEELEEIERNLPSKGIALEPYIERTRAGDIFLNFRLLNMGTLDVELVELWAAIPDNIREPSWPVMPVPPALAIENSTFQGKAYVCKRYLVGVKPDRTGYYRPDFEVLSQHMSPSMSPLLVKELRFLVRADLNADEQLQVVRYKVHAKGTSAAGEIPLKEIEGFQK
jgi:hypothetical protein